MKISGKNPSKYPQNRDRVSVIFNPATKDEETGNSSEKAAADRTEDDSGDCANDGKVLLGFEILVTLVVVMVVITF